MTPRRQIGIRKGAGLLLDGTRRSWQSRLSRPSLFRLRRNDPGLLRSGGRRRRLRSSPQSRNLLLFGDGPFREPSLLRGPGFGVYRLSAVTRDFDQVLVRVEEVDTLRCAAGTACIARALHVAHRYLMNPTYDKIGVRYSSSRLPDPY